MIDLKYPRLLDLFSQHLSPKRTESASFLIWYLENYYRLDTLEAVDAVCDQRGDRGVDGIYVNDDAETIIVFQSRISQRADRTVGDTPLKEFYGTLSQFKNRGTVEQLMNASKATQLALLIERADVLNKMAAYQVRGVFIANIDKDKNADDFLKLHPTISFCGRKSLQESYIQEKRTRPVATEARFDIGGFSVSEYKVDAATRAVIAPVRADQLIKLRGIADQSLFALNVRGSLGRTKVNRDIVRSIRDPLFHKHFPLFHNGITVTCEKLRVDDERISIKGYFVVNGCQSLSALFENQAHLTEGLRILTKFVELQFGSKLAEEVTRYSNNQNAVKPRDFKSNDDLQVRLQNEFAMHYRGQYFLEVKRGEKPVRGTVLSNEESGLHLMSFDLKEPWATHRKYQVFEDKYADIFGRPVVNADRLVMCRTLMDVVEGLLPKIENELVAKYALTKYLILFIIRLILETDKTGQLLIEEPAQFVRDRKARRKLASCVKHIVNDIVIDLNQEVQGYGDDFDYRGKLRDKAWAGRVASEIVATHRKLADRGNIKSFAASWKSPMGKSR